MATFEFFSGLIKVNFSYSGNFSLENILNSKLHEILTYDIAQLYSALASQPERTSGRWRKL